MEGFHGIVVGVEDILHVEICGGVDGVQQGPLATERDVLVLQFGFDGAETAHHDLLTDADIFRRLFPVVTAGGDDFIIPRVGLGVPDDNDGKHVDLLRVEVEECCDVDLLFLSSGLADVPDRGFRLTVFEKQLF